MIEMSDSIAGSHISRVIDAAILLADANGELVHFVFNETGVIVNPGDLSDAVYTRWDAARDLAYQKLITSPEYKERERLRLIEEAERNTRILCESAQTEAEMRETTSPWPRTKKQLIEYIDSLTDRNHDYGTSVYAMSLAAIAAFNFVGHKVGATGFQSSCADLDFLRRSRDIKGPFILLKGENCLYPQYDLAEDLATAMREWKPWLKEQAGENLAHSEIVHPDVEAHWKELVKS